MLKRRLTFIFGCIVVFFMFSRSILVNLLHLKSHHLKVHPKYHKINVCLIKVF